MIVYEKYLKIFIEKTNVRRKKRLRKFEKYNMQLLWVMDLILRILCKWMLLYFKFKYLKIYY